MPAPEEFLLLNAADMNQAQPEAGPSFTGDLAGGLFPTIPLTPCPATASRHGGELDAVGGSSDVLDLSREGPFDIHQDHPRSVASPQLLQDTQGCQFRMTSYDVETGGPDFAPAYGVHDPCLLEYGDVVEAPAWSTAGKSIPDDIILHHTKRQESQKPTSTIHVGSREGKGG